MISFFRITAGVDEWIEDFSALASIFCTFGQQNKDTNLVWHLQKKKKKGSNPLEGNSRVTLLKSWLSTTFLPMAVLNFRLCSIAAAVPCASGHPGHCGGCVLCGHFFTGFAQWPLLWHRQWKLHLPFQERQPRVSNIHGLCQCLTANDDTANDHEEFVLSVLTIQYWDQVLSSISSVLFLFPYLLPNQQYLAGDWPRQEVLMS